MPHTSQCRRIAVSMSRTMYAIWMMPPSIMAEPPGFAAARQSRPIRPARRRLRIVGGIGVVLEAGDQAATDQRPQLRRQRVGAGLRVDLLAADVERERPLVLRLLGRVLDRGLGPGIERKVLRCPRAPPRRSSRRTHRTGRQPSRRGGEGSSTGRQAKDDPAPISAPTPPPRGRRSSVGAATVRSSRAPGLFLSRPTRWTARSAYRSTMVLTVPCAIPDHRKPAAESPRGAREGAGSCGANDCDNCKRA